MKAAMLFNRTDALRPRARLIHALMMREAVSKHGHENLGLFWMIAEPLFLMSGIMLLWSLAHITHGSEIDVLPFALSAYSYLTLWRHITGGAIKCISANRSLRYHRQLHTLDFMTAKAILETLALFSTFILVYIPLYLMHRCPTLNDPLYLVGGFVFTGWFAFAFGLVLAAMSEFHESVRHLIGPIMYITLPLTGAFALQDWLPAPVQTALSWSPLVNCIEMIRAGLFSPDVAVTHFSTSYLITSCCILTCIGIILTRYAALKSED